MGEAFSRSLCPLIMSNYNMIMRYQIIFSALTNFLAQDDPGLSLSSLYQPWQLVFFFLFLGAQAPWLWSMYLVHFFLSKIYPVDILPLLKCRETLSLSSAAFLFIIFISQFYVLFLWFFFSYVSPMGSMIKINFWLSTPLAKELQASQRQAAPCYYGWLLILIYF